VMIVAIKTLNHHQNVANVVPNLVVLIPSLLHQNNIGVTYARTSNFRMEPIRSMPLYSMAMPQSIIIVMEAPFVSAPVHIVDGVIFKPQTPSGTKFVNLHENIPRNVNKVFASRPLNLGGGSSDPQGP